MNNLAEALPEEQRRVREDVLPAYESLRGMPGVNVEFAIMGIKESLKKAEIASASGDVIAMIRAFADLKEIKL